MIRFEKSKRNLIKIIIGIFVVLILGTGISLAARIWDPLWNPFRPDPEKVIAKMSKKMAEVKTLHSELKFDFGYEIKSETPKVESSFKTVMTAKVDSDEADPQNLKSAGDFDIVANFDGMQISVAGESITIGEDTYLKLNTIPFPFSIMFGEAQGQWIKYGDEETEKTKEAEKETIKKLEELFKDKKLYIVKKEFPDEEIRNVKVYHYLVALNKEEIKKLLPELFKTIQEFMGSDKPLAEGELEEVLSKLEEILGKIDEITAEIWIGKKDNYLYKIKAEKEIDLSQFYELVKGKPIKEIVAIKTDIDFSNFNQPVKIEAPENYKGLEEILPGALEEARAKARDARRIEDLRQISVVMILYYEDKGKYPSSINTLTSEPYLLVIPTDPGDGSCPGSYKWISNLQNPQKYCIYACLESGKFYAISPKGKKELDKPPTNLNCW